MIGKDSVAAVFDHRLTVVEGAMDKIADAVGEIAKSTTQIAALEVRHAETRDGLERAFDEIAKIQTQAAADKKSADDRLKLIEVEMPGLKTAKDWVYRGMAGICTIVVVAVVSLVVAK